VFRVKLPPYLIEGKLDALVAASEAHVDRLPNGWRTNLYSLTKCDIACADIPGISSLIDPIVTYVSMTMQLLYGYRTTLDHNQPHILKYSKESGHTGGKVVFRSVSAYHISRLFHEGWLTGVPCKEGRKSLRYRPMLDMFRSRIFSNSRLSIHVYYRNVFFLSLCQTVALHHDRCDVTANLSLSRHDAYSGGGTYIAALNRVIKLEQGEVLLHPGQLLHGGMPITAGTRYLLVTFANFER